MPLPSPDFPRAITPARRRLALLALALGGFGIGATEFVAMGLLPNIAHDLLPALYVSNHEESLARTGWLVSAYALGVVVGAPTIAATTARWPRKRLLLTLLTAFTVFTIAAAVLPSFGWVMAARFVAGLPHGAYFGIASLVAASLMGPGNRGKGVAMVLSGLTVANVVGVPAITWIGQGAGWRAAYLVVAAIFFTALISVALTVPSQPAEKDASIRNEISAFGNPRFWLVLALAALGFAGFFAYYAYVSPLVVNVTGLPEATVPLVLICVGLGMTAGNLLGGRVADRSTQRGLYISLFGSAATLVVLIATASFAPAVFILAFTLGFFGSFAGPSVQTRLLDIAPASPSIAAATMHSAMNIGNSLGAFLGGASIAATLNYRSQLWVGVVFALIGIGLTAWSFGLDRHRKRATA